jgi:hypothetical protein
VLELPQPETLRFRLGLGQGSDASQKKKAIDDGASGADSSSGGTVAGEKNRPEDRVLAWLGSVDLSPVNEPGMYRSKCYVGFV